MAGLTKSGGSEESFPDVDFDFNSDRAQELDKSFENLLSAEPTAFKMMVRAASMISPFPGISSLF